MVRSGCTGHDLLSRSSSDPAANAATISIDERCGQAWPVGGRRRRHARLLSQRPHSSSLSSISFAPALRLPALDWPDRRESRLRRGRLRGVHCGRDRRRRRAALDQRVPAPAVRMRRTCHRHHRRAWLAVAWLRCGPARHRRLWRIAMRLLHAWVGGGDVGAAGAGKGAQVERRRD